MEPPVVLGRNYFRFLVIINEFYFHHIPINLHTKVKFFRNEIIICKFIVKNPEMNDFEESKSEFVHSK